MKPINTNLTIYTDRQIKTDRETYEENRKLQNNDLSVDDMVWFYKREFARCRIIGTILSIVDSTVHVKTLFFFDGINEFYLNLSEVRKYDPTSHRK